MTFSRILLMAAVLLAATATPAFAVAAGDDTPDPDDLKKGQTLLIRDCSRCHAVGLTGDSPRPDAPAFRTLAARYPIESLEEALGEGIMSGHPDMPEIDYEAEDVGAIIDYLKSIQQR